MGQVHAIPAVAGQGGGLTATTPTVGIVLINWNRFAMIESCIRSIQAAEYEAIKIVVVDNGSTDRSVAEIRAAFPSVDLLENGTNLGFAGANNVGIEHLCRVGVDCILLLNDDTEISPRMIPTLVRALYADERTGIVGPRIFYFEEKEIVWFDGGSVDQLGQVSHPGADRAPRETPDMPVDVDYICGCALMMRASLIQDVGYMNDRYFMYYEETEFCTRVKARGYRVMLEPRATMWHKVRPGDRPTSPAYLYLMARNRLVYLRCTGASAATIAVAAGSILRTAASWAIQPRHRAMRPHARTLLLAVRDYCLGRLGPPPAGLARRPDPAAPPA